jgi:hypothetical protein
MRTESLTADAALGTGGKEQSAIAHLGAALAVQFIMIALNVCLVGIYAWDDGAITLAYSRTLAEDGRLALTAVSEQVEGYSSTAWLLGNAGIGLFRPDFEGAIAAAQVATGLFLGVATLFVWLIARSLELRSHTILAILLVFSLMGPAVTEVANGMEMTLLTASGLALFHAIHVRENRPLLAIAMVVFLTARFEAMVYFAALVTPLLFRGRYKGFIVLAGAGLAVVGFHTIARYMIFGDFVPNTIYAKMHQPYSLSGLQGVRSRLIAAVEIAATFFPLVLAVMALITLAWKRFPERFRALSAIRHEILTLAAPVAAVMLFSILIGKNWGYTGRMQFLALPFVLLLSGLLYDTLTVSVRPAVARPALVSICVLTILCSWSVSAARPILQMARTLSGSGGAPGEHLGTTPATFRETGLTVERLRQRIGLNMITFATPDVGGLALCCNRIRVVDLGLLASRRLAKEGYAVLPDLLAEEKPDLIEVHQDWGKHSRIYSVPQFQNNYHPVIIERTRFYLRNDHAEKLVERHMAQWCRTEDATCRTSALGAHRYDRVSTKADDDAFLAKSRVLMLTSL